MAKRPRVQLPKAGRCPDCGQPRTRTIYTCTTCEETTHDPAERHCRGLIPPWESKDGLTHFDHEPTWETLELAHTHPTPVDVVPVGPGPLERADPRVARALRDVAAVLANVPGGVGDHHASSAALRGGSAPGGAPHPGELARRRARKEGRRA